MESGPPGGPAVFLIHGWACSAFSYRHTMPALATAGFRALSMDLRGHGQSDKPRGFDPYRLDAFVADIVETLDALELSRTSLIGQSLGGAIAMRVALAQPERIERLALISPVGLGRVRLAPLARPLPRQLAPVLPHLASRGLFGAVLRLAYGPRAAVAEREVDEYWAPTRDPAFVQALYAMLQEIDWKPLTEQRLRALCQPTLLICGTRDVVIPPRSLARYTRYLRNLETVLIPNAGHAVHETSPAATNRELVRFLSAVALGGTRG